MLLKPIKPTEQQLALIRQQLGREPRGLAGIAVQNDQGVPLVLQMNTLVDDKPFPTLFWLASKDIYQAIARIETAGAVKALEQELAENADLRAEHLADQQRYVDLRWSTVTDQQKARIEKLGFMPLYIQYGIGGISQWDKIRCLHMHYAFHLAQGSTIGRILDERYQLNLVKALI
ncbi:MAG: hypothetical protein CSA61_02245 [Neptuniibacter caesariensis]|uniref:DUF501 domain-containing protein n=1 Tax=Neptuniibacter caesariensis TaxID=207954 RepID=A0A2G6JAB7_NEPCE|nr:MAG: hypothetical protein CSA61_02245 [Neptuniibacter caesariensis]